MAKTRSQKASVVSSRSGAHASPRGRSDFDATDVVSGAEIAIAKEVAGLIAKHGPGAVGAIKGALQRDAILSVSVQDSYKAGGEFVVELRCTNVTENGLYIEQVVAVEPKKAPFTYEVVSRSGPSVGMGGPTEPRKGEALPILLSEKVGNEASFIFKISETLETQKADSVRIEFNVSPLDQSKGVTVPVTLRLRRTR